jgi:hypothetical protein
MIDVARRGLRAQISRAVIAMILAVAALPACAHASTPRGFYGVMAADDPDQVELARMGEGGVGTLKINFVWGAVQPTAEGPLDWEHYDAVIGAAAQQGIRVLPTVYSSPSWSNYPSWYPPSRGTLGNFAYFVRAASARYGRGGTFWSEHPEIPPMPVRWWQFWNEPNSVLFWFHKQSPRRYVDYLRVFSHAVHNGDRSARVLLAGLFPNPYTRHNVRGIPLRPYISGIYKQRGAKRLFDGVAVHPYAVSPKTSLGDIKQVRRLMAKYGDARTPIWVTEIGWSTEGASASGLIVSPEEQAAKLSNTYRLMAAVRRRDRIAGVIWFAWRDRQGPDLFDHTGLVTNRLAPKPSWVAFADLAGGTP